MQPMLWLTNQGRRPLAISAIAVALVLFGSALSLLGVVALGLRIKSLVQFNPFRQRISILLNHWQIAGLLIALGLWWLWTAHGIWKLRTGAFISAWGISCLLLLRGLFALLPPIEAGDITVAAWLAAPAVVAMILLRLSSKAFKPEKAHS